ncbi:MAG: hypothetical protein JW881_00535 [Spirochaetales bacterium]|nr:hypothetical protein [Spirochaetales bacterium]
MLFIFLLLFSCVTLSAETDEPDLVPPDSPPGIDNAESGNDRLYSQNHFFGQEFTCFLPLSYHKDIYHFGFGGSLAYENYAINRLFSSGTTIPGIFIGITASLFIMGPADDYSIDFGECSIINAGASLGYQFLIPASGDVHIKAALYTGMRYYISLHFYSEALYVLYDPILAAGINIGIILEKFVILSVKAEYEFFIESMYVHTLQLSFGAGLLF